MYLFKYDYCFCEAKTCGNTDCYRHISRAPIGEPFSMANLEPNCDIRKDKEEVNQNV